MGRRLFSRDAFDRETRRSKRQREAEQNQRRTDLPPGGGGDETGPHGGAAAAVLVRPDQHALSTITATDQIEQELERFLHPDRRILNLER